nr:uncharacterized protein LOC109155335 [Ipomoea batatas]
MFDPTHRQCPSGLRPLPLSLDTAATDGEPRRHASSSSSSVTLRDDGGRAHLWSFLPFYDEQRAEQRHGPPSPTGISPPSGQQSSGVHRWRSTLADLTPPPPSSARQQRSTLAALPPPRDISVPAAASGFVDELTSHTRTIATGLLKIARLVENALAAILDDERFKKIEYDECEERQGGDEIQAGDDRGHEVETAQASEVEVGEHKAHASERAQQIEVEIVAPTDEIYTVVNPQGEKESRYKHFSSRYFEDKALAMDAPMA